MRNQDLSSMFSPRDRRSYVAKRDYSKKLGWKGKLLIAGLILFVLAYAYQALALTPENLGAETVHAEEEIKGNDFYCLEIARGNLRVDPKEVSANDLLALCAEYL